MIYSIVFKNYVSKREKFQFGRLLFMIFLIQARIMMYKIFNLIKTSWLYPFFFPYKSYYIANVSVKI